VFSSGDDDHRTDAGTMVRSVDRSFAVWAHTADEVQQVIQQDLAARRLALGRVYQICPQLGNKEPIRAMAVNLEGTVTTAYLDPAKGFYSEFRRIRYVDLRKVPRGPESVAFPEAS
jgi:hypothetical protein